MRFMFLIYGSTSRPVAIRTAARDAWIERLSVTGEWVAGRLLADASLTRTVRSAGGDCEVRHGPVSRNGYGLVGYAEVECDSAERAVRIAADWPWLPHHIVEIRPLMDDAGLEM